ncbi:zinc finger and SCAN domain-containing protein 4-like [Octodon degus]|uniref:Zinc finger and SCAN domain-containing protein 4-like n=1 Tax=Octodon degus TaxID=10160 RepID=A0A6P3V8W6_OCTDE|nr:zinc finger and SCAN domain-containing protein 4-like [Octodon degus]
MALDLRKSLSREPSSNNLEVENLAFNLNQDSAVRERETSEFSGLELNSLQNSQNPSARAEIQRLCETFHSWLQTRKRSKDEIVAQLAVEQFMLSGHCRDKAMLRRRWESSGKELEKFMEDLPDDCMKPAELIQVRMQGEEALFAEDMPLKEVIAHLTRQLSAKSLTGENIGPTFQASQNAPLEARQGRENKEDRGTNSWKVADVKDNSPNPEKEIGSQLMIPEESGHRPEGAGLSCENAHPSRGTRPVMCGLQEEPQKSPSYQDVPMDMGQGFSSRPDLSSPEPVSNHHRNEGHSYRDFHVSVDEAQRYSTRSQGSSPESVLNYHEANSDQDVSAEEQPRSSSMSDKSSPEAVQNIINEVNTSQNVSMEGRSRSSSRSDQSSPEPLTTHHSNEGNPICQGSQEGVTRFSKPYRCEECPETFRYPSLLQAHQRRHKNERPFVCTECKKGFFQRSDLRVHQMIHKTEKPFTCATCEISFTHKSNLRVHQRIHTGEKPYKCPFCDRSFRQSSTYYRHKKMHEKSGSQNVPSTSESSPAATETTMDTNPY